VGIKAQLYSSAKKRYLTHSDWSRPAQAQTPLSHGSAQRGVQVNSPPAPSITQKPDARSQLGSSIHCQLQLTLHVCSVAVQMNKLLHICPH